MESGVAFSPADDSEFRTEVYLLTGDELRVVRSEGGIEEQAMDGPVEYTPVHSPRGGFGNGGFIFLYTRCLDPVLFSSGGV